MWKGNSPWEAPAVYAPYMPLTSTATLPHTGKNPLGEMKAVACWAALETLVPQYSTKWDFTES